MLIGETTLDSRELQALYDRKFRLLCPRMTLERADGVEAFSGGGLIEQTPSGALRFTLLDSSCPMGEDEYLARYFREGARPGEFIPDARHFTLAASDVDGRTWTSTPLWMSDL